MSGNNNIHYGDIDIGRNIRFYLTAPQPCPYLPDRRERKVFTTLEGLNTDVLNQALTHAGFRRSQNIAYRPACDMCAKCVSVRIPIKDFEFKTHWRRIISSNNDIYSSINFPEATEERYALLTNYLESRHSGGGMSGMDGDDFIAMLEDCTNATRIIDFRLKEDCQFGKKDELVGCCLLDELNDGCSLVYSFYKPDNSKRSFGSFIILSQIIRMIEFELPFIYLGYWIEGSRKMEYKTRFKPLEALGPNGWSLLQL